MPTFRFPIRHCLLLVLLAALLGGCAAGRLQREGLALIDSGRVEEGLGKLSESSALEPANPAYRTVLLRNRELAANRLLARAGAERAAHHADAARQLYEQVLRIDAGNRNARAGLALLETDLRHDAALEAAAQARKRGDAGAAQAYLKRILLENPGHERALAMQRQVDEQLADAMPAGPALDGKFRKPVTLQFRDASLKVVFEALARTSGVNVLLDKDVKGDGKISLFVKDVSVADAIDLILLQSQLEKKIISDNTVLVYQNTPAKLKEFQDLKMRSFHLVNADAKTVLAMIKALLKTRDIVVHERTNSIVMRDTPEAIELAAKLVADQDIADPEVMLEVEVLEITGSRLSELGLNYPSALNFSLKGIGPGGSTTLDALHHIRSGDVLVSPAPSIALNLLWQDGDSNLLASPRIRARNHEKARVMIGDRVPVITNAVTPVSTGTPVITGSVQYLDVGLKLEVEPEIHLDNEVSIKINLEVSSIVKEVQNAVSGTLAYQVGTRNATTVLRLKDGETQILAGLISDEDRNSASRVPGLGQLPLLGRLFSSTRQDKRKSEIVLSITPRIINNGHGADAGKTEFWAGTEASPRSTPLMARPLGTVSSSAGAGAGAGRAAPAAPRAAAPAAIADAGAAAAPANPAGPASPASQPLIVAWQGPSQAKVGERISVTINAQSSQPVKGVGMRLEFDPAVLRPVDVSEGNFVTQNQLPSTFAKEIDAAGAITLDLASSSGAGVSGAGSVATIVFEAIGAAGHAALAATQVSASGPAGQAVAANSLDPLALTVIP